MKLVIRRFASMMEKVKYIGAIDQGTTSTRFIVFESKAPFNLVASHQIRHAQISYHPGWLEHDPEEIIDNVFACIRRVLVDTTELDLKSNIVSIGITNQRETIVVWDKETGKPLHNAIVWSDNRTAEICSRFSESNELVRKTTGLPISPYFSATKLVWLMENTVGLREKLSAGDARFGTIESFILARILKPSGTLHKRHITDITNASRTLLVNISTGKWDDAMIDLFTIPRNCLGEIVSNSEIFGDLDIDLILNGSSLDNNHTAQSSIVVSGALGDQNAALLGQGCIGALQGKITYGTGAFLLMNTGTERVTSINKLLTSPAYRIPALNNGELVYVLEGPVASAGSALDFISSMTGLSVNEMGKQAQLVKTTNGVSFVPAFSGLLAPHWDNTARGIISGINTTTTQSHICLAAFESIALQVSDIHTALLSDLSVSGDDFVIKVDGGASANDLLLQLQSDIIDCPILRPDNIEATCLGAAFAAAMAHGVDSLITADTISDHLSITRKEIFKDNGTESNQLIGKPYSVFHPKRDISYRKTTLHQWKLALQKACQ